MTIKTYGSRYERFRGNFSNFAAKQALTMEQKFGKNSIDIEALREFCEQSGIAERCEREGELVEYRKDITFETKK